MDNFFYYLLLIFYIICKPFWSWTFVFGILIGCIFMEIVLAYFISLKLIVLRPREIYYFRSLYFNYIGVHLNDHIPALDEILQDHLNCFR